MLTLQRWHLMCHYKRRRLAWNSCPDFGLFHHLCLNVLTLQYTFPFFHPDVSLFSLTDATVSSCLQHLEEFSYCRQKTHIEPTAARRERRGHASGAVSAKWRWCQGWGGAERGPGRRGSEGVWPVHAFHHEGAAGAGRQGPGVCAQVTHTPQHLSLIHTHMHTQ